MFFILIAASFPIIATIKGYIKSGIVLWVGFIVSLFTRPWHDFKGYEGLGEALLLGFIVVPIYLIGFLSWFIGYLQRKRKSRTDNY
ncbi:hypothetical protein [Niallia taxi]|uniref:hypothetical protein n=1 Tax=Niallia taxi TaxID=2499688 RepID=UPI0015F4208B|nr:hypothetical protein [Niallia taxi]